MCVNKAKYFKLPKGKILSLVVNIEKIGSERNTSMQRKTLNLATVCES